MRIKNYLISGLLFFLFGCSSTDYEINQDVWGADKIDVKTAEDSIKGKTLWIGWQRNPIEGQKYRISKYPNQGEYIYFGIDGEMISKIDGSSRKYKGVWHSDDEYICINWIDLHKAKTWFRGAEIVKSSRPNLCFQVLERKSAFESDWHIFSVGGGFFGVMSIERAQEGNTIESFVDKEPSNTENSTKST